MDIFIEILKFTIPTIISLLGVYFIIDRFLRSEEDRRNFEIKKSVADIITPVKLTAYERLVLFLERTSPESLVLRVQKSEMTNMDLQSALLATIRQEYEHNLTQQLYVSNQATLFVKNAKESITNLINMCAAKVDPTENSTKLAVIILETYCSVENPPAKVAVDFLKAEIKSYFG